MKPLILSALLIVLSGCTQPVPEKAATKDRADEIIAAINAGRADPQAINKLFAELKAIREEQAANHPSTTPAKSLRVDQQSGTGERSTRLLYFTASWCQPCQEMPAAYASVLPEQWTIGPGAENHIQEIDCSDGRPPLAEQYGVESVPTFVLLRDGRAVETLRRFSGETIPAFLRRATDAYNGRQRGTRRTSSSTGYGSSGASYGSMGDTLPPAYAVSGFSRTGPASAGGYGRSYAEDSGSFMSAGGYGSAGSPTYGLMPRRTVIRRRGLRGVCIDGVCY